MRDFEEGKDVLDKSVVYFLKIDFTFIFLSTVLGTQHN